MTPIQGTIGPHEAVLFAVGLAGDPAPWTVATIRRANSIAAAAGLTLDAKSSGGSGSVVPRRYGPAKAVQLAAPAEVLAMLPPSTVMAGAAFSKWLAAVDKCRPTAARIEDIHQAALRTPLWRSHPSDSTRYLIRLRPLSAEELELIEPLISAVERSVITPHGAGAVAMATSLVGAHWLHRPKTKGPATFTLAPWAMRPASGLELATAAQGRRGPAAILARLADLDPGLTATEAAIATAARRCLQRAA